MRLTSRLHTLRESPAGAVLLTVTLAVLAGLVTDAALDARAADPDASPTWSQWRGAERDGSVAGATWPRDLSGVVPVWRLELGKGYSGPVVAVDRVFVVETVDDAHARVRALRRDTGAEIWRREWKARGEVPFYAARQGAWERSTPAYDGRVLYVGDMREVLHALDGETGRELWTLDVPAQFGSGTPSFGFASSPLLAPPHLYVQAANGLIKVDTRSGDVVWRTVPTGDSVMSNGAFSSPVMATLHGVPQVVVFTRSRLSGVEPETGRVLWQQEVPNFRGMNIVTPVVYDDGVFVSQYRNGSFFFRTTVDARPDGESEVHATFAADTAWTHKGSGYMSSPVVIGDHVYQHLGNGRLSSLDLRTGQENWRTIPLGEYWSMVWQDDRILALDSEGTLRLVRATPERFELIDEREVATTSTWGHVAVSGDALFVRELEAITVFHWAPSVAN